MWIVTDGNGNELARGFGSEEEAEEAAEQLQADGTEDAQTAYVN